MTIYQLQKRMWPGTTDKTGKYWEVAMSWAEGECLDSYLTKDVDMLEWGCGGSTIKYAESVNHIDSIEHQLEWYARWRLGNQIKECLDKQGYCSFEAEL